MHCRAQVIIAVCACVLVGSIGVGCNSGEQSGDNRTVDVEPEVSRRHSVSLSPQSSSSPRKRPEPIELPIYEPVRVHDTGSEPRRVLRYQSGRDARTFTIQADVTMREFVNSAWTERVHLPKIEYGLELRTSSVATPRMSTEITPATKFFHVRGLTPSIGEGAHARPDVKPGTDSTDQRGAGAAEEFVARYRAFLERRRASVGIDPVGLLGDMTLTPDVARSESASQVRNEIRQLLLQGIVRWPVEAVGKGARWEVVTLMYRGRGAVKQTARYELLSVADDKVRVRVETTQIGEHQIIDTPDLPADRTMELVALFWRSHGDLEVSLNWPTPLGGTMDVEMRTHGRTIFAQRSEDYFLETTGSVSLVTTPVERSSSTNPADVP